MIRLVAPAVVLVVAAGAAAYGSELDDLRAENARLRARVAELEAARAARPDGALAAALEARAADAVQVTRGDDARATVVSTRPSALEVTGGGPARGSFSWRAAPPSDRIDLVLGIRASAARLRDARTLRLVTDGAPHDCAVVGYGTETITAARAAGPAGSQETVTVGVPLPTLHALAAARDARATLGTLQFRLTPEQLAVARAFAQRVAP